VPRKQVILTVSVPKKIAEFLREASYSGISQPVGNSSRIPETARLIRDLQVISGQDSKHMIPFLLPFEYSVRHNVIIIITIVLRKGNTPIISGVTPIATPLIGRYVIFYGGCNLRAM
jgi:hypothetical protein